jgi:hypothetical protein
VLGLGKPFEHKGVMAHIRFGVVGRQTKTHEDRQAEPVCLGDRHLERGVELGALRVLHPIEDIVAGLFRRIIELGQTLGLDHSRTSLRQPISAVFTSRGQ